MIFEVDKKDYFSYKIISFIRDYKHFLLYQMQTIIINYYIIIKNGISLITIHIVDICYLMRMKEQLKLKRKLIDFKIKVSN